MPAAPWSRIQPLPSSERIATSGMNGHFAARPDVQSTFCPAWNQPDSPARLERVCSSMLQKPQGPVVPALRLFGRLPLILRMGPMAAAAADKGGGAVKGVV